MSQIITVDDLISDVRSMIDEDNQVSVDDTLDILPALNRAQNYAANILSRHYESPMLTYKSIPIVGGQQEYLIPENAFEQRLEKVEIKYNNVYSTVTRIDFRDLTDYESNTLSGFPQYYTVIGGKYRLVPTPTTALSLRIWYLLEPSPLVVSQGRINIVNTAGNYIYVDTVGAGLSTESDNLNSYVNVIDAQTGFRKATLQIQNIVANKITFKTVPIRSTVLNLDVDTSISNLLVNSDVDNGGPDVSIEPDDFICNVRGTCVPFFKKPFSNFIIEYAINELRRKVGDSTADEKQVLADLETQVTKSWVGRESSIRVRMVNRHWMPTTRWRY